MTSPWDACQPGTAERQERLNIAAWVDPADLWRYPDPEQWIADYEAWHLSQAGNRSRGAYYTPRPVAAYLAQRTLGRRLEQIGDHIRASLEAGRLDEATTRFRIVQGWSIVDPACGSGVFLLEALGLLTAFYRRFPVFHTAHPAHAALEQIHGVDLEALAAAVTEARLYHWACRLDGLDPDTAPPPPDHILCDNTLAPQAPRLHNQRWDFILGNPPYLSEVRGQKGRFRTLGQGNGYYRAKMDLCDAFLAWSLHALNRDGELAFVLPEYWQQRSSTAALRESLLETGQISESWYFGDNSLFASAPGHHSSLLIWRKTGRPHPEDGWLHLGKGSQAEPHESALSEGRLLLHPRNRKLLIGPPSEIALLARLSALPPLLAGQDIQQGIVIPQGRLKKADRRKLPGERPCPEAGFLLTETEVTALELTETEKAWLRPFYAPAGFQPFSGFNRAPDYWLIYADAAFRRHLQANPHDWPNLKVHLESFSPVNTSAFAPYGLHRPRQAGWFEGTNKLYAPRQVAAPAFAPIPHPAYVGEGFYVIRTAPQAAGWLSALLNSTLAWFWFYHQKRKGHRLQIDKDVLSAFPAPPDPAGLQARLQALARPWTQNRPPAIQAQVDPLVFEAYRLTPAEVAALEAWRDRLTASLK